MLASHLTLSSALLLLSPFGGAASPAEPASQFRSPGNAGVADFGLNRSLPPSNFKPVGAPAAPGRQEPEGVTSYSVPSSLTFQPRHTSVSTDGVSAQAHGSVYPIVGLPSQHDAGLTRTARAASTSLSSFRKPFQTSKPLAPGTGNAVAQYPKSSHTVTLLNAGSENLIPNSYVIKYNMSHGHQAIRAHVQHTTSGMLRRSLNASVPMQFRVYNVSTFVAVSLSSVSAAIMTDMASDPIVEYVEADARMFTQSWVAQPDAEAGLARLSHCRPGPNRTYVYDSTAGEGVTAYVVDTGINVNHPDFENRATYGFNTVTRTDTYGHGTHVAGIIGSRTFGVAKKASLVAVKVLEGRSGSSSDIMAGLQWAWDDITSKGRLGKALINISLGGPRLQVYNDMIQTLYNNGVMAAVAAGNNNADARDFSPASAPSAITVGNIDPETDVRAPTSNYGGFVDIWAPGQNIRSTWIDDGSAFPTQTLSGTSMAAPHVAGVLALIMSKDGLTEPTAVEAKMREQAQGTGAEARDVPGSPRFIANNGYNDCRPAAVSPSVSSSGVANPVSFSAAPTWSPPMYGTKGMGINH